MEIGSTYSKTPAQVALNYGLFCRSIVFHGTFDELDRRFIQDMAENTAREIYVKKFLEPNPFLTDAITGLPAVKKQTYLRATLEFPESPALKSKSKWQLWSSDKHRHCILSSGGKRVGAALVYSSERLPVL